MTSRLYPTVLTVGLMLLLPVSGVAEQKTKATKKTKPAKKNKVNTGLHVWSGFGTRLVPTGLRLKTTGGYRQELSKSDSLLLKDTYVETGVTTEITPSNFWGGAYLEILPLAVLKLRASVQSLTYFGAWGYLHDPGDPNDSNYPQWQQSDIQDNTLTAGQAATGVMYDLKATPQAKIGPIVFQAPTMYRVVDMNIGGAYYESSFDFLMQPKDSYWSTKPTLGYLFEFDDAWLLAGARWQHARTFGTDISRDMPTAMALWKMPWQPFSWGDMKLAVLAGYWVDAPHPNRDKTGYLAAELSIEELFRIE